MVAVKNSEGKYLQLFDDEWDCWLFPYFRSTDNNRADVETSTSKLLGVDVSCEYVTVAKHCKYSVSDEVYKIYNHKLYKSDISDIPEQMQKAEFDLSVRKFKWMSFNEMENDSLIMEKNDDIVAFVKTYC